MKIIIFVSVFLLAAYTIAAVLIYESRNNADEARHELCVAIKKTNMAEQQLWLRAIARSPHANPDQVEIFKHDLNELFPNINCPGG